MKILEYEDLTKTIRKERAALADAHAARSKPPKKVAATCRHR